MAYTQSVLHAARRRLAEARVEREAENARNLARAYERFPRLAEIDRQLSSTVAQAVAVSFRRGEDPAEAVARLRDQNLAPGRQPHLPEMRRLRLCGRADVRVPAGAVPAGAEEGADQSPLHGPRPL